MNTSAAGSGLLYHPRLHWMVLGVIALAVTISGIQMKLTTHAATPNSLYTTTVSSAPIRTNLTVALRLNSETEPINVVSGELTYSADKFEFISADVVGGAFPSIIESYGGNGRVKLVVSTQGGEPAVTGDQLVANLTFRAFATGTGNIDVTNTSLALSSNTNINSLTTFTGSTVNITKGRGHK